MMLNTVVVTTARPTRRQFVVQFQCGCDVSAGDILRDNYSLTETLRRVDPWEYSGRWLVVCPVG